MVIDPFTVATLARSVMTVLGNLWAPDTTYALAVIDPVTGAIIASAASSFLGSIFGGGGDKAATKQRNKEFQFAQNLERLQQQRTEDQLLRTRTNQNTLNPVRRDLLAALVQRLGIKVNPQDLVGTAGAAKPPNLPVIK